MARLTQTTLAGLPGWSTPMGADDSILPEVDNASDVGKASNRVRDVFAGRNVIAAQFRLSALNTAPSSASAAGTLGEVRIVSGFIYICVATNTWQRVAIATW